MPLLRRRGAGIRWPSRNALPPRKRKPTLLESLRLKRASEGRKRPSKWLHDFERWIGYVLERVGEGVAAIRSEAHEVGFWDVLRKEEVAVEDARLSDIRKGDVIHDPKLAYSHPAMSRARGFLERPLTVREVRSIGNRARGKPMAECIAELLGAGARPEVGRPEA